MSGCLNRCVIISALYNSLYIIVFVFFVVSHHNYNVLEYEADDASTPAESLPSIGREHK